MQPLTKTCVCPIVSFLSNIDFWIVRAARDTVVVRVSRVLIFTRFISIFAVRVAASIALCVAMPLCHALCKLHLQTRGQIIHGRFRLQNNVMLLPMQNALHVIRCVSASMCKRMHVEIHVQVRAHHILQIHGQLHDIVQVLGQSLAMRSNATMCKVKSVCKT